MKVSIIFKLLFNLYIKGSNTSAIAESQENAQKDHAAILALMQEGIPNNLATRLTAVEEVGIHLDEKVLESK